MELNVNVVAKDGRTVVMTAAQAKAVESLNNTRKGGCASVIGYQPKTNWITPPVQNIQMLTHFSYNKLIKRKLKALEAIEYSDVALAVANDKKFGAKPAMECLELFTERKQKLIDGIMRNLNDDPKNAQSAAHDRCYAYIGDVKIHLKTEKDKDGLKQPVLGSGVTVLCDTIMVPYLELNVTTIVAGERKTVNSGPAVLMGNFIEKCMNQRSIGYKTLSLREGNFKELRVDRKKFIPEDVNRFGDLIS